MYAFKMRAKLLRDESRDPVIQSHDKAESSWRGCYSQPSETRGRLAFHLQLSLEDHSLLLRYSLDLLDRARMITAL